MQVFVAFAVGAVVVGLLRAGPTDPMQAVAAAVGLVFIASAVQGVLTTLRKGALRERYRAALQQYGREFGETEFFSAMVAASGRGLSSEGRAFQRPSGFDRDLDDDVGDLTDRRRWSKEAELLAIVGELEDAPGVYANGVVIVLVAALFMAYRFVTAPLPVDDAPPPVAAAEAPAAQPFPATLPEPELPDRYGRMPSDYAAMQAAAPVKMRFVLERCGAVRDNDTGLRWFVGPDQTFRRDDAERYVRGLRQCGLGWRMPKVAELRAIYDPTQTAGAGYEFEGVTYPPHVSPMFSNLGRGTWVWMAEDAGANAFNLHVGRPVQLLNDPGPQTVRVMAVSER